MTSLTLKPTVVIWNSLYAGLFSH